MLEDAVRVLVPARPSKAAPSIVRLEVGLPALDQLVREVVGPVPALRSEELGWSELHRRGSKLLVAEAYELLAGYLREAHRLDPRTVARLGGAERDPARVAALRTQLAEDRRRHVEWLDGTVLVLPVLPGPVPTLAAFDRVVLNQLTLPVNYLGLPGLAMQPRGGVGEQGSGGIPFAIQLVGPPGGELMVLEVARLLLGRSAR